MLDALFEESLALSGQLRARYAKSLGYVAKNWADVCKEVNASIPEIYATIYSHISGTKRDTKEQELMDYIPGYRLIHITELAEEKQNLERVLNEKNYSKDKMILPLLVNYSSNYICYYKSSEGDEEICMLLHDNGELTVMHETPNKFLETICELYKQGVYFLDNDGYLDYDMAKEGEIGSKLNPGIRYWME